MTSRVSVSPSSSTERNISRSSSSMTSDSLTRCDHVPQLAPRPPAVGARPGPTDGAASRGDRGERHEHAAQQPGDGRGGECVRPRLRGLARTSRNANETSADRDRDEQDGPPGHRPVDPTASVMHTVAVISASSRTNAAPRRRRAGCSVSARTRPARRVPSASSSATADSRDAHDGHLAGGQGGSGGDAEDGDDDEQRDGDVRHRTARNVSSSRRWSANISFSSSGSAWS